MKNNYFVRLKNRPTLTIEHEHIENPSEVKEAIVQSLPDGVTESEVIDIMCFCPSCERQTMMTLVEALEEITEISVLFDLNFLQSYFLSHDNAVEAKTQEARIAILKMAQAGIEMGATLRAHAS